MKFKEKRKIEIIDKEILPNNVVSIEVEEGCDCLVLRYFYNRDGHSTREEVTEAKLKLYHNLYKVWYGEKK